LTRCTKSAVRNLVLSTARLNSIGAKNYAMRNVVTALSQLRR